MCRSEKYGKVERHVYVHGADIKYSFQFSNKKWLKADIDVEYFNTSWHFIDGQNRRI